MNSPSNRTIPELFSDAVGQLAKLVSNEFELARAELSEKASHAKRAVGMMGAGAIILMPGLVLLLFAISAALIRHGFSEPVAYLMSGGCATFVSVAMIAVGLNRLSGEALKPSVTLDQVQRDKVAAREMIR